jgi:hypothetical protein
VSDPGCYIRASYTLLSVGKLIPATAQMSPQIFILFRARLSPCVIDLRIVLLIDSCSVGVMH